MLLRALKGSLFIFIFFWGGEGNVLFGSVFFLESIRDELFVVGIGVL